MSATTHTHAREALLQTELDDYVRPRVETIVVSRGGKSTRKLHLGHAIEPICSARHRNVRHWDEKPVVVYPPDYFPFCDECVEKYFGIEVVSNV